MWRVRVLALAELRRRLRNRSALVTAVVAPLSMAIVFGVLVGGTGDVELRLGVVDQDGSDLSAQLVDGLADQPADSPLVVEVRDDEAAVRDDVDLGTLDVALVLPPGFGTAATGGRSELVVVRSPDRAISGEVGRAVASSIAAGFERADLAIRADVATSGEPPDAALLEAATTLRPPLEIVDLPAGGGELHVAAFYGASMSILFLFFTIGFATRSLLAERVDGTLDRILATPTSPAAVIAGKVAAVSVLGLCGFLVTWAATEAVFGASWGPPVTVLAVIVATVVAIGGVALLVAGFATTPRQADSLTSMVAFAFALLGGNFVDPSGGPALLRTVRLLTPNGWALLAFTDAAADRAGLADVLPAVAVLVVIGAISGSVGLLRVRRTVAR